MSKREAIEKGNDSKKRARILSMTKSYFYSMKFKKERILYSECSVHLLHNSLYGWLFVKKTFEVLGLNYDTLFEDGGHANYIFAYI